MLSSSYLPPHINAKDANKVPLHFILRNEIESNHILELVALCGFELFWWEDTENGGCIFQMFSLIKGNFIDKFYFSRATCFCYEVYRQLCEYLTFYHYYHHSNFI